MAGIGAKKIGPHRRPVRRHDDQVGLDRRGFLEDLVIDTALPHSGGDARSIDARFARYDGERLLGGLALLGVEIGGDIFGQHHRCHRQHVQKAHRAAPGLRQRRCRRNCGFGQIGIGEINRHENGFEHLRLPVRLQPSIN